MLDREFCLRYIAFACLDIDNYNGSTDDQLSKGMEYLQNITAVEKDEVISNFKKVMSNCEKIFGKFAFRRMNTEERRGPINKALFEAWSIVIKSLNDSSVQKLIINRKILFDKFSSLCGTYDFQNALRGSDKSSVKTRIKEINTIVNEVIKL